MKDEEFRELNKERLKDIGIIRSEFKSFKRRISIILNLFIPGIGFIIYGSSYLKGFISFALFMLYNILYFSQMSTGHVFLQVLCYVPAIVIWVVSTVMVADLDD